MTNSDDAVKNQGEPSPGTLRFIRGAGHVSLVGTLVLFIVLGIVYQDTEAPYAEVWHLILAHFAGGRALNAAVGIQKGFNSYFLLFQSCMQDFIIMFYLYPLFITGYRQVSRLPFVGHVLKDVRRLALRHKDKIAPYGAIGLMVFVIFPFWSTGPLVGVVVGYMLGISTAVTFTMVMLGDIIAVAAWIWAYDRVKDYNHTLALLILVIIFAIAVGGTFYARVLSRKRKRAGAAAPENSTETSPPAKTDDGPAAAPGSKDGPKNSENEAPLPGGATKDS